MTSARHAISYGSSRPTVISTGTVHGLRRAAETGEAVATLDALRTGSAMTRGTLKRQWSVEAPRLVPPEPLADELTLLPRHRGVAA